MDHQNYNEQTHPKPKPSSKSDLMSSAKVLADAAKSAYSKDSDKIDKAKVAGAAADFIGAAKHYGKFEDKNFGKYVDKAENYLHQYHSSSSPPVPASGTGTHGEGYSSSGVHVPSSRPGQGYSSGGGHFPSSRPEAGTYGEGYPSGGGHVPSSRPGAGTYGEGYPSGGGHVPSSRPGEGTYGEGYSSSGGHVPSSRPGEGKHGEGYSSSGGASAGGYGEYIKLAQGLLKKDDHGSSAGGGSGGSGDYIKLAQGLFKKH